MTFFLGCDVAKLKVDIALVNENGALRWIDKIPNELGALTTYLLTLSGHYGHGVTTCIVEATGRYHYPLLQAALAADTPIRVYNPLLTKQGIKSSVRGKKTDRTDALLIARMGLRGEGRLYTPEPYMATKLQVRSYQKLGSLSGDLSRHVEHLTAMTDTSLSTALQEAFTAIQVSIASARRVLYAELASSTDGPTFRRLQTIPGVGPYVAASLIGEIQDIQRFTTAHSLVAYSGLDPRIRQSGKNLNSTGRLTKRGSSYLRRSLFIAAGAARRYDPYFKALYDKKRAEGKPYTVAVCVVARKLLAVARAVWLSEQPYDLDFWEHS